LAAWGPSNDWNAWLYGFMGAEYVSSIIISVFDYPFLILCQSFFNIYLLCDVILKFFGLAFHP